MEQQPTDEPAGWIGANCKLKKTVDTIEKLKDITVFVLVFCCLPYCLVIVYDQKLKFDLEGLHSL